MTPSLVIRRILFPTDFSDASRRAGQTAAALAHHFDARLIVLHVISPITDPELRRAALRSTTAELSSDVFVEAETVTGIPARQILAYASRHPIDLIVMGTHGRTGVSHAVLGSVAEAVVRRAPCLVLTVPAALARPEPSTVTIEEVVSRCIVCASPSSDQICETCRARIRGEALEHKQRDERAGR
jgi:nucleotide-binding universal stress UspA family protein